MTLLSRFLPSQSPTAASEVVRASIGGTVGVLIIGSVSSFWFGSPGLGLVLIASIGASATLAFAVPSSLFAQPYAIVGGNLLAALIGVSVARWIPWPLLAAAMALGGSIAAMSLCRCLHPPSGAVALVAVIGGPHVVAAGYGFVLVPVLLNSILLVVAAIAFNNLTGRSYPHPHPAPRPSTLP